MLSKRIIQRLLLLVSISGGLLLVFGFLVVPLLLQSALHSDAFRKLVSQKTSAFLKAEGEYLPLQWNGFAAYSDGYAARGQAGSALTELRADQIRADLSPLGILNHAWQINSLDLQRLQLVFARPTGTAPVQPALPESSRSSTGWLSWPDHLDLRRIQIQETDVQWPAGQLRQTRATLTPAGDAWNITGFGGQLQLSDWPVLRVDHFRVRAKPGELFLTDSQFKLSDSESVNVTGQINLQSPPALDLVVSVNGVSITPFLPDDWRAKFHGNLGGDAKVTGAENLTVAGKINLSNGRIEALPVLDRIAVFTQTVQFRQIPLQVATADFVWTAPTLTVSNLVLESSGLLRIEGGFMVTQRNLTGDLQVGVTPSSLRWLPGSQTRVFTVQRAGYVWTTVHVTGPVDNLNEDLSTRLVRAAGTELIENATDTLQKGAQQLLDLLKPLKP